ncbi:hypothetical protein CYLTODRAFT_424904 [Cylindrobasidium torrendii FP15055 ss-10]|uniref:BZIP domain-containing protein n=1 Tax=Cylindrobasidium torrendii FP15055 ss-10 TaxID=1314674 RepID=A0A0D7B2H9_9AGAR|nr:hypothetical protein CYLTODRAFT_424904 [Cylindrobasidium torrendii FP15055 ss-10]
MSIEYHDFLRLIASLDPENMGTNPMIKSTTNGVDGALATLHGHPGDVSHPGIPYQPYGILDGALLGDEDVKYNLSDDAIFSCTASPENTASHAPVQKRVRVQTRKEQNKASARKTRERRKAAATALEERLTANKLALAEVERSNVELLKGIEFAKGRVQAYTAALQPQ